jgi:predicted ATP-dependent endonuclease of OLD family
VSKNHTEKAELELDSKNDYNMKINFDHHRGKKLDKMKSLKKITKELTDTVKKYEQKELKTSKNKSRDSKASFSISKHDKKERTMSRTNVDKKSIDYRVSESRERPLGFQKAIPKVKSKKSNEMMKSRQREEKKSKSKQYVD